MPVRLRDWLDPLTFLAAQSQARSEDPIGLIQMPEGVAAPVSPWHGWAGDIFTTREQVLLDEDADLFTPGISGPADQAPLWSGQWMDAVSTWVVSYKFEASFMAQPVTSTGAPGATRLGETGNLFIQFKSGAHCMYPNVPPQMALSFHNAASKGRWVHSNLYKIWQYVLIQSPYEGARRAAIHEATHKSFVREIGEEANRRITERFRMEGLNVPEFLGVRETIEGATTAEEQFEVPELWFGTTGVP
jgi:hypothetical protein